MKLKNHGFTDIPTMMVAVIFVAIIFITFVYLSQEFNSPDRISNPTAGLIQPPQNNVAPPDNTIVNGNEDKCDVGKDLVAASELANYNCEAMPRCEWRSRGGKAMNYFACCPKNVMELPDKFGIYSRCFILVD